ncbi:DUF4157 domain-containing protein [Dokdonia ponticola]|uniref:DUF4157 domain-containing protein n=1 Tax=Dokdonia ponticola TaxID=2041041 RepID=A0ABV9HQR6_9FLAO
MKTPSNSKNKLHSNVHSSKPFFNKDGDGRFFSKPNEIEEPFFSPSTIQTKPTIGQPNDTYEQEADMTAEKVVRTLEKPNSSLPIQKKGEMHEQEEEIQMKEKSMEEMDVMRKPVFGSEDNSLVQAKSIEHQLSDSKGKGNPLTKDVRNTMESAFGTDFSSVKIHTDSRAVQMNNAIGAQAFTNKDDIYFNKDKFDSHSKEGSRLLAHELTHVVQQSNSQGMIQRMAAFKYAVDFMDSVGKRGKNLAPDVNTAINELIALGFMSIADAKSERPTQQQLSPSNRLTAIPTISDKNLPKLIAAIKSFQRVVIGSKSPDGRIDRHGAAHQYLNTATSSPSTRDIQNIKKNRKAIGLTTVSGAQELGGGLTASVGNITNGNVPTDLLNVQKRLVELKILSSANATSENPNTIIQANQATYPSQPVYIKPKHIPRTIRAIVKFQNPRHRRKNPRGKDVGWWARKNLLGTKIWTAKVVAPNDATFILMRDYSVHSFSFKNKAKQHVKSSFYGPVRSGHTVSAKGLTTRGTAQPNHPVKEYTAYGLNNAQGKALKWVEHAEGRFDAVNTYDRAIVSFGFIQFAGLRSLEKLLALIKNDSPTEFRDLFQKYGIDVEYNIKNNRINKAQATVVDVVTGTIKRGRPALEAIRKSPVLTAAFVKAGHYIQVQRAQIEMATKKYALPAIKIRFGQNIKVLGTSISTSKRRISDVMRSEKGLAALISCYINLPARVRPIFRNAIRSVGSGTAKATTWGTLSRLSDSDIINRALRDPNLPSTWRNRLNEIIADTNLSSTK